MHAELGHDVLGVDQHVEQMRDRRALIAADVGDARLQQRLGDREDAFAAEGLAVAQPERLHFLLERAFHQGLRQIVGAPTINIIAGSNLEKRAEENQLLEHSVIISRFLRNFLPYVPVLDHLAVFQPEDVDDCRSARARRRHVMDV